MLDEKQQDKPIDELLPPNYFGEWSENLERQTNYLNSIGMYKFSQALSCLAKNDKVMGEICLEGSLGAFLLIEKDPKFIRSIKSLFDQNFGENYYFLHQENIERDGMKIAEYELKRWLFMDYFYEIIGTYVMRNKEKLEKLLKQTKPITSPEKALYHK